MKRFTNILVHVDSRVDQQALLSRATELAKSHQAKLKIVDVVPEFSWPVRLAAPDHKEVLQAIIGQKQAVVEKLVVAVQKNGVEVTSKVLCGKTSDQIIIEAVHAKHDLVMKDAKGQFSQQPGTFGATALQLVRYCPCPVWAFRPRRSTGQEKIVAAIDATATDDVHMSLNRDILAWSFAIAVNPPPHIAHVWSVYGESLIKDYMKQDEYEVLVEDAKQEAAGQLDKLLEPHRLPLTDPHVHLLRGDATQELTRFVNTDAYDVLVMGTVARTGITGLFIGNTADTLLGQVECSVVAIKPANFKTPIQVT